MADWWHHDIVEPGKLPLLMALAALILTFGITRMITRLIRAGKGPFRNVSTGGGVHIHHVVPGILLMVVGGFTAVAGGQHGYGSAIAAAVFGAGTGLVLDEFALVLHLSDVYWAKEGAQSVEVVLVTVTLAGLLLTGFSPFGIDQLGEQERSDRISAVITIVVNLLLALLALCKGKPRMAVLGILIPFVALFGAVRIARPHSLWAKRFYRNRPKARTKSDLRALRHDHRWDSLRRRATYAIGGKPTRPG